VAQIEVMTSAAASTKVDEILGRDDSPAFRGRGWFGVYYRHGEKFQGSTATQVKRQQWDVMRHNVWLR